MTTALEKFEQTQLKSNLPQFRAGDTVRVHVKIKEGDKERIQVFEDILWPGSGTYLPPAFTHNRENRGRTLRPGASRQALLSAQA